VIFSLLRLWVRFVQITFKSDHPVYGMTESCRLRSSLYAERCRSIDRARDHCIRMVIDTLGA
jgi:hypothetical protein